MNEKEQDFAFEEKFNVSDFRRADCHNFAELIEELMLYMKETNIKHGCNCEFFRMDFRHSYPSERMEPLTSNFILHLMWGSKKELREIEDEKATAHQQTARASDKE